ncbi:hypothetical protein FDE82_04495 [Clostridium botulinum]|nr:hypothetical protein [Clostridium botulinum]
MTAIVMKWCLKLWKIKANRCSAKHPFLKGHSKKLDKSSAKLLSPL